MSQNKEIALQLSRAIMNGDWSLVDSILSDDFTYVNNSAPALNKAQYISFMRDVLCIAMTEMDMTFHHVVSEGDIVAVNYSNAMTHTATFYGYPATNKRVVATGQFMRQIKNNQIVAEWQTTNAIGLIEQIKNHR